MSDLFQDGADRHDAKCGTLIQLTPDVRGSAIFGGPGDCYRYRLERWIEPVRRTVMFLWMNPSGAGARVNDRTVAKGWRFTRRWDCQRMLVANVHAYCCTDQARLAEVADPFGPDNMAYLLAMADEADIVVVGYGTPRIPALPERGPYVVRALRDAGVRLHVLRLSKDGVPVHPLYLPETLTPLPWEPRDAE